MLKFKNEFTMTEELFVEQNQHSIFKWCSMIMIVFMFIFLLPKWWFWVIGSFVAAVVFAVIGACEQTKLESMYKKQLADNDGVPCEIIVEFYDTYVHMQTNYGDDEIIPYASIVKSKYKQNLMLFIVDRGYYIPIKKDSFIIGSLSTFIGAMSVRGL